MKVKGANEESVGGLLSVGPVDVAPDVQKTTPVRRFHRRVEFKLALHSDAGDVQVHWPESDEGLVFRGRLVWPDEDSMIVDLLPWPQDVVDVELVPQ